MGTLDETYQTERRRPWRAPAEERPQPADFSLRTLRELVTPPRFIRVLGHERGRPSWSFWVWSIQARNSTESKERHPYANAAPKEI